MMVRFRHYVVDVDVVDVDCYYNDNFDIVDDF